jgi:cell division control protein 45
LDLSQRLQRVVVRIGTSIIEDRLVKTLKNFRLVVMKETPETAIFLHPLTLTKLASFLMDAMKETGRAYLPFVIAALNTKTERYLVVGLDGRGETLRKK